MLAIPEELVCADGAENVALAPPAGALKITVRLLSRCPTLSLTVTCSGDANWNPVSVHWGVPPVAVIEAGGPMTSSVKLVVTDPQFVDEATVIV